MPGDDAEDDNLPTSRVDELRVEERPRPAEDDTTLGQLRVLRISHSAVVDAWRERERALRGLGLDVELLSARAWDEGGTTVPLVPRPGEPVHGVRTVGTHPALFVYDPVPLWRALGRDWDVLDIHEEPFALATAEILAIRWLQARRRRCPGPPFFLYSAQNLDKRYPWPFRSLERRALVGAAGIAVCNRAAKDILERKGARGSVEVIPLGVDLPDAGTLVPRPVPHPDPASRAPRPEPAAVRVGYAGRLAVHKGVDVLVRAVLDDERLHLVVAGDGPEADELRRAAQPAGERITFLGALDGPALADFYTSLDVLAIPSLDTPGWVEQFGRVAVEAMSHGVPVVASDSGALPDLVGGVGTLVPPGDPVALGRALIAVGLDPELAAEQRRRGLERAAECTWPSVAKRYRHLYRSALAAVPEGHVRAGAAAAPVGPGPEVVLVAYGRPDLVAAALAPLRGSLPITVVDNSSMPEIAEVAEAAGARYLDPGRNGGFAFGVNHALERRQEPERDVLLLNPDATIDLAGVEALQRALHSRPGVASVGPSQTDESGAVPQVRWPYPSPGATWLEAVGLGRIRRTPLTRSFVIGSVLLLNRAALADVGGFDERFFLYAEETDWAYRANLRGWVHLEVDDVVATHLGGATSSDPSRRDIHFHASQEHFLRKHHGAVGWQTARAGSVLGSAIRSVLLTGGRREEARRRLRSFVKGPAKVEAELMATDEGDA